MNEINDLLADGLKVWNIVLTNRQKEQFELYTEKIKFWNTKINITAVKDDKDIIIKHFIDSLASTQYYSFSNQKVMDIGTGAGLPGLPIKILFPNISLTFVDSSSKKIVVLKDICESLGIKDCIFKNTNIELLGKDFDYRGHYDVVLSRAVAPVNTLLELSIPLLKEKGKTIIYKGPKADKEVENSRNALGVLHSEVTQNACFCLPFTDYTRKIIIVEKLGITPLKYPRVVGTPKKRPL